jgi:hypothetical protein
MTPDLAYIRGDYVRRVIAARCPELNATDIPMAFTGVETPDLSAEVANAVLDVIDALSAQLDRIEARAA